ncbi:MAG: RDD family protein [Propionibacteriaceae bacterium]
MVFISTNAGLPSDEPTTPGWYPDPNYDHLERWWTGAGWTADIRPRIVSAAPQQQSSAALARTGERFLAWFLDDVIISALTLLVSWPATARITHQFLTWMRESVGVNPSTVTTTPTLDPADLIWIGLAGFACCMLYYFLQGHFGGRTLGQRALGLRMIPDDDPAATGLDWNRAGWRSFTWAALRALPNVHFYFSILVFLSASMVYRHPRRQTWPDLFAHTLVVRSESVKLP